MVTIDNYANPITRRKISKLKHAKDLSINLGSGGRGLPGWVNVEIRLHSDTTICLDIRRPLPFSTGSARRILAEHVVEHLDFSHDARKLFDEFYRVLATGAVVRIVVPNAERFLEAYVKKEKHLWCNLGWDVDRLPGDIHTPMHVINHIFHQGGEHLFAYDFETLCWALHEAGFKTVLKQEFRVSADAELAIDQENHRPYSLYVEAIR